MTHMHAHLSTPVLLLLLLAAVSPIQAAKKRFTVEELREAPPSEVAESVRAAIAPTATRVLDPKGKAFIDLWFVKSAPMEAAQDELGVEFSSLGAGNLIAVARVHKKNDDFKGQRFPPGIYTCRYALRPADGDHQGVSETRDFLLLSPVDLDTGPERKDAEGLIKLSKKTANGGHPTVLYLAEPSGGSEKLPCIVVDEEDELWLLEFEIPRAEPHKPIRLRLVVKGVSPDA